MVGGALLAEFRAHTASVKCIDVNMDEPSQSSVYIFDIHCVNNFDITLSG